MDIGVREVSGTEASLASCIEEGTVPKPAVMDWKDWQIWRKGEGMRPRVSLGDPAPHAAVGPTTNRQEAALWKATMERLHGADWRALLEEQQVAAGDAEELEPDAAAVPASGGASVVGTPALSSVLDGTPP